MAYEQVGFVNDTVPDINAENLNHMDDGIHDAHEMISDIQDDIEIDNQILLGKKRLNLIAPYTDWTIKYGASTESINENSFSFTIASGTSFAFGTTIQLADLPMGVGDNLYLAIKNLTYDSGSTVVLFLDSSNNEISRITNTERKSFVYISGAIPNNTKSIIIRFQGTAITTISAGACMLSNYPFDNSTVFTRDIAQADGVVDRLSETEKDLAEFELDIKGEETNIPVGSSTGEYYATSGGKLITVTNAGSKAYHIDLSNYIGKQIIVYYEITALASTSARYTGLCDSEMYYSEAYAEKNMTEEGFKFNVTNAYHDLYISMRTDSTKLRVYYKSIKGELDKIWDAIDSSSADGNKVIYVSTTGSDDENTGTILSPYKTIAKALSVGKNIVLMSGIYTGETVLVDDLDYDEISIKGMEGKPVVLNFATKFLVNDGSETKVSGYNKVYSKACESFPFTEGNTKARMYQDYVPDISTEIALADRHPLQRGKQYRCDSTIIKQCNSIAAIDALDEGKYGFFWDNGTMYFSRPQASSAEHPIVIPKKDVSFIRQTGGRGKKNQCRIVLNNIEVRYADIRLSYSANHVLSDISVKYPYVSFGGCFYLYCVSNCQLIKCEACSVTSGGSIGDGFNVDTDDTAGYETAVSLTARLIDCWSHDNNDDGYSDHDRSEVTVEGGLFEFNGKGGVTPAYGANDNIFNAVSRYNSGSGFLLTGSPSADNGRLCTSAYMEGCVAYGQTAGFTTTESTSVIKAVNCITYGNSVGYDAEGGGHIYAVNCKSNDTTAKYGGVVIQSVNDLT